ncbi:MAG: DUF2867 domain-containing protein [Paludibacteraceae bacterium]|nr:DUF2867 domain-containing protein [Paludibacteraceae bacterium]
MEKISKQYEIPSHSIILNNGTFGSVDYVDSYKVCIKTEETVDEILNRVFQSPRWVDTLMAVRNAIVSVFNLKTGGKVPPKNQYEVGDKTDIFTISARNDNEIVMAEEDKHLNFRTSVSVVRRGEDCEVYLTTIVHYNNFFGRFYFFFVKPFHQQIMKVCMRNLLTTD